MPPPLHGYAAITALMVESLRTAAAVEVLDTSPGTLRRGARYHAHRVWRIAHAVWRLLWRGREAGRTLYHAIGGGGGVIYDLLLAAMARVRGYRIFVHHHAFSYIDRWNALFAALIMVVGPQATHICLCPTMAQRLRGRYPAIASTFVLSNAAFIFPAPTVRAPPRPPYRIGFLSNLIPDKGLDIVIDVFRTVLGALPGAVLVIAGPAPRSDAQELLARAAQEFASQFEYLGAVYGAQKEAFYRDIDLFLFPTRYANEAEPLVVLEAVAAGLPVIATPRGCIADRLADGGGLASPEAEFSAIAADTISRWFGDSAKMAELSRAARACAVSLHDRARADLAQLVATIVSMENVPIGATHRVGQEIHPVR